VIGGNVGLTDRQPGRLNAAMGMFKVRVKVANRDDAARSFEDDFLVDTGAVYSLVPADRLEAIGVDPTLAREVVLADGRREQLRVGEARMTLADFGETVTCLVIFAPPGSLHLLGATALKNFGVDADPVAGRLKRVAAIIAGSSAGFA